VIFRPELAAKVMAGEKTVTRRVFSDNPGSPWWGEGCALLVGGVYSVCPGRGEYAIGHVRVTSVTSERLCDIGEVDARAEGFKDRAEFLQAFAGINPRVPLDVSVWRVAFEVVPEVPSVPVLF
jgi:hypothetical protein